MRLLIVESQEERLAEAMATVRELQHAFVIEVRCADTLEAALSELGWADAVVTDLFFPETRRLAFVAKPSALRLAERCLELGKPVVALSADDGSDTDARPALAWFRTRGMELVDCPPRGTERERIRNWRLAIRLAIRQHQGGRQLCRQSLLTEIWISMVDPGTLM